MTISLLHPSRHRATRAGEAVAEWLGKRSGRHPIEYILSIDEDDRQMAEYRRLAAQHGVRLLIHRNRNLVEASNRAAAVATGDLLIQLADDFGCPQNWDDALVLALGDRRDVAVLVDDGLGASTTTLTIVDRAFYRHRGYLLFPGYRHMFSDNDLEEASRRSGKLLDARHLLFPHRHHTSGAVPYDETYFKGECSWGHDAHVYHKRQACDFGVRPQTPGDVVKCLWIDVQHYLFHRPRTILKGMVRRLR